MARWQTAAAMVLCGALLIAVASLPSASGRPRRNRAGRGGRSRVSSSSASNAYREARTQGSVELASEAPSESELQSLYGQRTERSLKEFTAWFAKNDGGWHRSVVLEVDEAANDGLGHVKVVTNAEIDAQSEVVRVPEKLLLDSRMLQDSVPPSFTEHNKLALVLLDQLALGRDSSWHPYIQLLPSRLSSPLYFSEDDMAALQGTYAGVMARHMLKRVKTFEVEAVRWAKGARPQSVADRVFTPQLVRWATSMVQSRAFTISKPKDQNHPLNGRPFLAPGADLLNHSPTAEVGWVLGSKNRAAASIGGAFQIYALQAHRASAEVYNHYQDFGSAHLLSHYGFSVKDNENDFLPISLGLPRHELDTELGYYKRSLLKQLGLRQVQKLRAGALPVSMLNTVRVLALAAPLAESVIDEVRDATADHLKVSMRSEKRAQMMLQEAFNSLLSGLPSGEQGSTKMSGLIKSVIDNERSLLQKGIKWLDSQAVHGDAPFNPEEEEALVDAGGAATLL